MKRDLPDDLPGRLVRAGLPAPKAAPPAPEALPGAVRAALVRSRRLRTARRVVAVAAAAGIAGALVAAGLVLRRPADPPAAQVSGLSGTAVMTPLGGQAIALAEGMGVAEGARLTTLPGGSARLMLVTGSELQLGPAAELGVERLARLQRFRLTSGRATVHVKPLAPGQRFVLATEDVEVEVHGTRFEVESVQVDAACDVATATRVQVLEGSVEIRRGADTVLLEAPAHWPECRGAEALEPSTAPAAEPAPAPSPKVRAPRASLSELNLKYRAAISARRRGDAKAALQQFEDFYRRYPDSQLAEAARVEALRLLSKTDPDGARAAAREYLSLYPRGFARDEAKAMLGP